MTLPEPTRHTIGEILNISSHRPWGMPHGTWRYYQEWNDVIFLHWQVDHHDLESFVPAGPEIDSFEGQYWVSLVAFSLSQLPYRFSSMKRSPGGYYSHNKGSNDHFNIAYSPGQSPQKKPDLDCWLTERYALYQDCEHSINEFQIHHIEWPLREIELSTLEVDYPRFHKLLNGPPDKFHYSPGVQVIAWGKNKKVL